MKIFSGLLLFSFLVTVFDVEAQRTIGLTNYTSDASEGYLLFAPFNFNETYLIDACGALVHKWEHSEMLGTASELLPNGNLLRTERMLSAVNGAGVGGRFIELDWEGQVVRTIEIADDNLHAHHDFAVLPNGNILAILWDVHDRAETISLGGNGDILDATIWSEKIVELAPTTDSWEVIWEWRVWDHLVQDYDSVGLNFGVISEHPRRFNLNMRGTYLDANLDWLHFNSITTSADGRQIVLSARSMNEVYIIDRTTTTAEAATSSGGEFGHGGDLLYRYGNDHNYADTVVAPRPLYGQHDARFATDGPNAGSLSVFNNGVNRPGGEFSGVYRWLPNQDLTGNYVLVDDRFAAPIEVQEIPLDVSLYSSILSSAQPIETGGYVVNSGRLGAFLEYDQNGTELWRYVSPVGANGPVRQGLQASGSTIFQVNHYATDDPRFDGRTLTAGDPIELDPAISLCLVVGIADVSLEDFSVYPNPSQAMLTIIDAPVDATRAQVYDGQGRVVIDEPLAGGQLDLSSIASGLYTVALSNREGRILGRVRVMKR